MAPSKAISKEKSHNIITPIRKSKRIAAIENRHRNRESSTQHITDCEEQSNDDCAILSLNDDCFREIFSNLSIEDLFEVSQCCRRFWAVADEEASSRYRKEKFTYFHEYKPHRKIIARFGKYMQNVTSHRKLDDLSQLNKSTIDTPQSKWSWLRMCTSLKTLHIIKYTHIYYDRFATEIYGNLVNLSIDGGKGGIDQLECIVKACTNLKSIELKTQVFSPDIFDWIATLKNIEKATIRLVRPLSSGHITAFRQLKKLKYLCLDFVFQRHFIPVIAALNEIASLTKLDLYVRSFPDGFADSLDELQNIEECCVFMTTNQYQRINYEFFNRFTKSIRNYHVAFDYSRPATVKLQRKNVQ